MKQEAPSHLNFSLDQTFFGFNPEDRKTLHSILFDLIWHGEGRWDWDTVYNMPVFLRKFWVQQINEKLQPPEKSNTNISKMPTPTKKR